MTRFEQTTLNGDIFARQGYLTTDGTTRLNVDILAAPAVTDLDGDGLLDMLVGNGYGDVVRFEQTMVNGSVFAPQSLSTISLSALARLAVTDVDGDGLLDLVTGDIDGNVRRFEQTAINSSVFTSLDDLTTNGTTAIVTGNSAAPAVTDIDGDGLLDLLVGNSGRLRAYEQTVAQGTVFAPPPPPQDFLTTGNVVVDEGEEFEEYVQAGFAAPVVTDVDGDGLLDILVGNSQGNVQRYEQRAPPLFILDIAPATAGAGTTVVLTGTNLTGTTAVTVNGVAATAVTVIDDGHVSFTVPAGASTAQTVTVTTPAGTSPAYTRFEVQLQVVSTSPAVNAISAPTANSALAITFTEPVTAASITPSATTAIRVFSAQVGGRKAGTLSLSGATVSYVSTLSGGRANFQPGETVSVTVPAVVQTASGLQLPKQVYQFTAATGGAGRGKFAAPATNPEVAVGQLPYSLAVGDVDGDGDLDMLVANNIDNTVSIRLNDGSGSYAAPATNPEVAVGGNNPVVAVGDVDGDGDLDMLVANSFGGGRVSVNLNNGSGSFAGGSDFYVGNNPQDLTVGDVDGDGDLDVLTANYSNGSIGSGTVSVRLNDGTGTFTALTLNPAVGRGPSTVTVGDVDGDGDLDLLTANFVDNTVSVRLNDGAGNFTPPATNPEVAVGSGAGSVALGDVDGDGDLDLVVTNVSDDNVSVRLNDGTGNFTPPATNPEVAVGDSPYTVALGDVDGDGDLDLVVSNKAGSTYTNALRYGTVSVRLNNGTGSFSAPATTPEPSVGTATAEFGPGPSGLVLRDVDGDGDLDLLTANSGSNNVSVRLNQDVPLPVELTEFTATVAGPALVRLAWATATEQNSQNFEVERSADGRTFTRIGTVPAAGTSTSPRSYELLDAVLPSDAARLYYRLKQVDTDGTFAYSPVRTVTFPHSLTPAFTPSLSVFPNPTQGSATLTGAAPGTAVTVLDALGRPVLSATADGAGRAVLALPAGLPAGVYVVRSGARTVKLVRE
ncbi:FG-GAP-like repeat-containing protein [Hymenobacter sp. J193]|uniref:FG-GAP-like repeat-containing protein n=1 Tax=Hymenobacter sp. J193 TaxID=2898429 RepID=UPI0021506D16|nr:FG-GAP-like repeat-containing protein [Hymenobacter sp. J193]MCR5887792.1 FG-GAP-like repeat-containing protein [Hymenobacter sp. J193]